MSPKDEPDRSHAQSLATVAVFLAFTFAFVMTAWACEDAFIDFRVVKNALLGHGLTWNPGERVWNFTSALWTLLLIPVSGLLGSEYWAAMLLSFVFSAVSFLLLCRLAERPFATLSVSALVLCSASAVDWSSGGLENPLLHMLALGLVTFTAAVCDDTKPWQKSWLGLCCCAGLAGVTRIDAVLLSAPCFLVALLSLRSRAVSWADNRQVLSCMLIGALPFIVWEAFALVYFGDVVPNTAHAKLPPGFGFAQLAPFGLIYIFATSWLDPPLVVVFAVAAVGGVLWSRRWGLFVWSASMLSVVYTLLVGADYMAGRFTSPWLYLVAGALALALRDRAREGKGFPRAAMIAALVVSVSSWYSLRIARGAWDIDYKVNQYSMQFGIADERAYHFYGTGMRHVFSVGKIDHLWVLLDPQELRAYNGSSLVAKSSIGLFGWAVGDTTEIIDMLALSDRFLARLPSCPILRPGHFRRLFPTGYFDSKRDGTSHFRNTTLAALWNDTELVARGKLWSAARWQAISRLVLGHYTDEELIRAARTGSEDFGNRIAADVKEITCDTPIKASGVETYLLSTEQDRRVQPR